ncbi:hypothetical protein HID58_001620 [Brassica napus]|uniref:Uncharacterized protein n=1 Tax=Brassica napus TaxID=3708 RepID=A0ABQ8EJZ6_BRANA|nr:hypothetical protein HID58_001620 [Brassica napus]
MRQSSQPKGNSSISSDRKTNEKTVASSETARPNGKSTASSAIVMKPNASTALSKSESDHRLHRVLDMLERCRGCVTYVVALNRPKKKKQRKSNSNRGSGGVTEAAVERRSGDQGRD